MGIAGAGKLEHWIRPEALDTSPFGQEMVHLLSPFDPLIIQRKRLQQFFDYEHRFEAYVPKEKRLYGYFALPVLVGDEVVAAIDLKADRRPAKAPDPTVDLGRTRFSSVASGADRNGIGSF